MQRQPRQSWADISDETTDEEGADDRRSPIGQPAPAPPPRALEAPALQREPRRSCADISDETTDEEGADDRRSPIEQQAKREPPPPPPPQPAFPRRHMSRGSGPLNVGSSLHPLLCGSACSFFLRGSCSVGLSCNFCHCEHGKRVTLDKASREILRRPRPEVGFLVLADALASKVLDMKLGDGADAMVRAWSREVGLSRTDWRELAAVDRAGVRPSQLRRVWGCLHKMHAQDVSALARAILQGEPRAGALDDLMTILRSVSQERGIGVSLAESSQ